MKTTLMPNTAERAPGAAGPTEAQRVVHLVPSLEIGGLERVVYEMVLESRALAPTVVCLTQLGALGVELQARGIPVQVLGMERGPLVTLGRLCVRLRSLRPAVLHCHNLLSHLYGGLAARLCRIPHVVLTKHGAFLPSSGFSWHLNRWLLKRSHVVAVSAEIRARMTGLIPPNGTGSLRYIPNGISLTPYSRLPDRREARRRLGWSETDYLLGMVARLSEGKDHPGLLQALQRVRQTVPQARLILVGDGPMRERIEGTIRQLELDDAVVLLGERRDIPQILAALDVFVLASESEGIPLTILEAMAADLPVLATAVGGIPEVVIPDETGLLVPPQSPQLLADAILTLLRDPNRARRMGAAGCNRVKQQFDVKKVVGSYEALYERLCVQESAAKTRTLTADS